MSEKIINKRVVLITGSSGGLGKAIVEEFLNNNCIVIAGIKDDYTLEFEDIKSNDLHVIKLDICNLEDIKKCQEYIKKLGKLEILVNNAGISGWGKSAEKTIEEEKMVFDVNLWGPINLIKTFYNELNENEGKVINILSIGGDVTTPFLSAYCSSKTALEKFVTGFYLENPKTNIRFLNLKLGPLDKGLCGSSLKKEDSKYRENVRNHMVKIQKYHGYKVSKVAKYIENFVNSDTKFKTKTLGVWANMIVKVGKIIPQPLYQILIGKIYKNF